VNVEDHTPPTPTLATLPTITHDCSASAGVPTTIQTPSGPKVVFEAPTATDNCGLIAGETADPVTYQVPGTYVVHWVYDDGHGNTTSQNQTINVTTDTSPPVPDVALLPPLTGECSATVTTVPTATDACTGTVAGTTSDPLTYTTQGDFTITWHYDDGNGHVSTQAQQVHVHDVTPPTISPAPPDVDRSTGPGNTTCTVLVTDAELGTPPTATDNCSATVTRSGVPAGNQFPVGTTTVVYTATDAGGTTRSVTQHVTVHDTTPPTITAPGTVTLNTGAGATSCGVIVSNLDATLGTATAHDNCGATVARSGVPIGNAFPVGDTTITYTATDGAGLTASAIQHVIVVDNTPPTISCQANIIADFDPAVNGAVVTYTPPVGTDNCGGATTVRTGLASGSTFPLGTSTVSFTVTDGVGLTATCSFKVTVALTSLIGLDSVTITGSGFADSYSSAGGYPATKGSLANILSNGTITIGGSGKVWGNVRSTRVNVAMTGSAQVTGNATAGTSVTTSGSATVLGTRTNNALAPVMTLPSVSACSPFSSNSGITGTYTYNASTGDLTLSGVNIATLANGNYCFHNVTLGNSSQLKVNGPVLIKMTGTLNTSGSSNLNNTTQIPNNLRILSSYSGTNGVTIGNSVSVYALVYAPSTGLNISGSAPLFGTFAGKAITIGNSGAIHYDTQLKTIWPDIWALLP
jgi:hypothetical protein